MSLEADAATYAADAVPALDTSNILAQITAVARELREAKGDVTRAEEELKAAQGRVRNLEEHTLPELMREAAQERLRTLDGYDLQLSEVIRASIPSGRMGEAVMWLRANGQGSIVKTEVKLTFGKGQEQTAAEAADALQRAGFTPDFKPSVHPQTLSAAVREMMANGVDVPLPLLGVWVQPVVKMKEIKT